MTLRLTFNHPDPRRPPRTVLEGDTFTELVDEWNALPWFVDLAPQEFREHLADMSGGRVEWPAPDEDLIMGNVEESSASQFSAGLRLDGTPDNRGAR